MVWVLASSPLNTPAPLLSSMGDLQGHWYLDYHSIIRVVDVISTLPNSRRHVLMMKSKKCLSRFVMMSSSLLKLVIREVARLGVVHQGEVLSRSIIIDHVLFVFCVVKEPGACCVRVASMAYRGTKIETLSPSKWAQQWDIHV